MRYCEFLHSNENDCELASLYDKACRIRGCFIEPFITSVNLNIAYRSLEPITFSKLSFISEKKTITANIRRKWIENFCTIHKEGLQKIQKFIAYPLCSKMFATVEFLLGPQRGAAEHLKIHSMPTMFENVRYSWNFAWTTKRGSGTFKDP